MTSFGLVIQFQGLLHNIMKLCGIHCFNIGHFFNLYKKRKIWELNRMGLFLKYFFLVGFFRLLPDFFRFPPTLKLFCESFEKSEVPNTNTSKAYLPHSARYLDHFIHNHVFLISQTQSKLSQSSVYASLCSKLYRLLCQWQPLKTRGE